MQKQLFQEGLEKDPNLKQPRLPAGLLSSLGIKQDMRIRSIEQEIRGIANTGNVFMVKKRFLQDLVSWFSLFLVHIFLYLEQEAWQPLGHICLRHGALLACWQAWGQGIPYSPFWLGMSA